MLSAKTSGANIDLLFFSVYDNCTSMDIRQPSAFGMSFGVTYSISGLACFATNFAPHETFPSLSTPMIS